MRILIITSDKTGHGHKSITSAICERLEAAECPPKVTVVNGFHLGGSVGKFIEASYSPVTKYARPLWSMFYNFSSRFSNKVNMFTSLFIKRRFLKLIKDTQPTVIVTVHPAFIGSILNILESENLRIPVISVIADLVSLNHLWIDERAAYTICPNDIAMEIAVSLGVPATKLKNHGFPVRKSFFNARECCRDNAPKSQKLSILLVNGCETRANMVKIARTVMDSYDCRLTIITGRDEKLRSDLLKAFQDKQYKDRLEILGYVSNMEDYMCSNDILIARGSPNVIMEAHCCRIPPVMIGVLPGQEAGNKDYMVANNLGVACDDVDSLRDIIDDLLADNMRKLLEIKQNQDEFMKTDMTVDTAQLILELCEA